MRLRTLLVLLVVVPGTSVALTNEDCDPSDMPLARSLSVAASFTDGTTELESGTATVVSDDYSDCNPTCPDGSTRSRQNAYNHFGIVVPDGATKLTITLTGGDSGDADLYAKFGAQPDQRDFDERSWNNGNEESIVIDDPQAGEWQIAVHGWRPYNDASLTATVEGGDQPRERKPCLEKPEDLPQAVNDMWGEPDRREHHQLWHFVSGGGWNRLPPRRQDELRQRGWEPPDHNQQQLGLDFICMHRQMVDYTQQAFARVGEPCKLGGWDIEQFPWGLDNNDTDRVWPAPEWPGQTPAFKTRRSAEDMRDQVTSTFTNDDWLRSASLGQVSRAVERSFHNWMHMRFAQPQPGGDVCDTNWLGSTCSSQQNPYFWKLHPMIDQIPERWARANAGREVELYQGGPTFTVPENFARGHADEASDDDVYLWTSNLVFREHDCWMGPMPGPPRIAGAPLVAQSFFGDDPHRGHDMSPAMLANNRANTRAAVEMLNQSGDELRDFTINSIQDNILPVYTMMSAMLSPEEKASIKTNLDLLAAPFADGTRTGVPLLSPDERWMLDVILNTPEDFQRPGPSMVTTLKRAVRKVHDAGTDGALLGAPLPPRIQPEQRQSAYEILELVKKNEGVMRIPEVREALGL